MTSVSRRSLVRDRALLPFDVQQARDAGRDVRQLAREEARARQTRPILASRDAPATKLLVGSLQPVLK